MTTNKANNTPHLTNTHIPLITNRQHVTRRKKHSNVYCIAGDRSYALLALNLSPPWCLLPFYPPNILILHILTTFPLINNKYNTTHITPCPVPSYESHLRLDRMWKYSINDVLLILFGGQRGETPSLYLRDTSHTYLPFPFKFNLHILPTCPNSGSVWVRRVQHLPMCLLPG